MKHVPTIIFSFILLTTQSFAQDSIITHRNYVSEFTSSSSKTIEGSYYKYQPVRLHEGDKIILEYASNDFIPELIIKDSLGDIVKKIAGFKTSGNVNGKISYVFVATYNMLYYLTFSTTQPNKTGKYHASVYFYNKQADDVTDNSSFCTKLNYVIANSRLNFDFLKSDNQTQLSTKYEPTIHLCKEKNCTISEGNNRTYNCTCLKTNDKAAADKAYAELLADMNSCLEKYNKQSGGTATEPEMTYKLEGNEMSDLNSMHTLMNVKGAVELKCKKLRDYYYITIAVL